MQQDLNDIYYFVQVVDHGGFSQASRALNLPKSRLSRRIALLEERLGVRLLQRSTRSFSVTPIGQQYYGHCRAMLVEAEAAENVIAMSQSEPCGTLRMTCPIALLHAHVGQMATGYMAQFPKVNVELIGINRPVDVVAEGLDLAIRVRPLPLEDSDLAMRVLSHTTQHLVASPKLLAEYPAIKHPIDLTTLPSLSYGPSIERQVWRLQGPEGERVSQHHQPRFATTDMRTLLDATLAGEGVAQLPSLLMDDDIESGRLRRLLPGWNLQQEVIHAVFPSRRGLVPAVRAMLDHLAKGFELVSAS